MTNECCYFASIILCLLHTRPLCTDFPNRRLRDERCVCAGNGSWYMHLGRCGLWSYHEAGLCRPPVACTQPGSIALQPPWPTPHWSSLMPPLLLHPIPCLRTWSPGMSWVYRVIKHLWNQVRPSPGGCDALPRWRSYIMEINAIHLNSVFLCDDSKLDGRVFLFLALGVLDMMTCTRPLWWEALFRHANGPGDELLLCSWCRCVVGRLWRSPFTL